MEQMLAYNPLLTIYHNHPIFSVLMVAIMETFKILKTIEVKCMISFLLISPFSVVGNIYLLR